MAKVELIDFTGRGRADEKWHAAHVLMLTKDTRLELGNGTARERLAVIASMSEEEKLEELTTMTQTIPSSWEFVDVTFQLSGVSRACAQQITRTRTASYAMQSQRVVDGSALGVVNPFPANEVHLSVLFDDCARSAKECYELLIENGAARQDARAILPMNAECSLMAKYNLRSFVDLVRARESLRTQGEYRDIIAQMKLEVVHAWPWAQSFFVPRDALVIELLESAVNNLGITVGSGVGWQIAKAIDLLRKA
jgi:flavin-dependent thymidylate synthase